MKTFTDGGILVRGLTVAEKTALSSAATELGLPSLSQLCVFLARQHLAKRHTEFKPGTELPRVGASRIARKVAQWQTPGEAAAKEKNSPRGRARHHSDAAVRHSTMPTEGA